MKNYIKFNKILNRIILEFGIIIFKIFRFTPKISHRALINLYCITNGHLNEYLHKRLSRVSKKQNFRNTFFKISEEQIRFKIEEIEKNGYTVLDSLLPENLIDEVLEITKDFEAFNDSRNKVKFNDQKSDSHLFRYDFKHVIQNKGVQKLIFDSTIYSIVKSYFKSEPIFDFAALWIITDFFKTSTSEAAQFFHFDMEKIKWLKIFIYLNDVNEENAPHQYIKGSHISGSKPEKLLRKGYQRISDDEIYKHYNNDDLVSIEGKKGTVIIGDTKCWHKGGQLKNGNRKLLQLEFSSSLFGVNQKKFKVNNLNSQLIKDLNSNKFFSQQIIAS